LHWHHNRGWSRGRWICWRRVIWINLSCSQEENMRIH
jgi:hypothetical protein